MTTLLLPPVSPQPASGVDASRPERVLLPHIAWGTYLALLADVGDGAARLTYDRGWLEIEMPGPAHEKMKKFAGIMVEKTLDRQRIAFEPSGATTWQRPDLLRGLEADECYHVQSVSLVLGRDELDLTVDPPPDLAIEVKVTSPLLDKVAVYRGLGVPELWRIRGDGACDMMRLDAAGVYQPLTVSVAVPPLTPAVVSHYVRLRAELNHSGAMARFEAEFLSTLGDRSPA